MGELVMAIMKLYLHENGRVTRYCEAWVHGSKVVRHWGQLGERGESLVLPRRPEFSEEEDIARVLQPWRKRGYTAIDQADLSLVDVVYRIVGFGTPQDLEKRHALQDRLSELLGWTGLGDVDGGGTGSGLMEATCVVVDIDVAKQVIEANLRGTEFGDYSEIRTAGV
jgi:predicted DNA-binding WGR domain protein